MTCTSYCLEECDGHCQDYAAFLAGKRREWTGQAIPIADTFPTDGLFPLQAALSQWALRKGRAALFADTGLGKTRMQLAWASQVPGSGARCSHRWPWPLRPSPKASPSE